MSWSPSSSLVLPALLAAGCAAPPPDAAPATADTRWLLTWHRPLPAQGEALATFEAEASAIAGVPVRQVAAVSDRMRAVVLACEGSSGCAAAQSRLRSDPRVIELAPDVRRRAVTP